jgi:oligosaccharide repeat unit polymerase
MLYNPIIYAAFFGATILLIPIENPIGWGSQFELNYEYSLAIPILYVCTFIAIHFSTYKATAPQKTENIGFSKKSFLLLSAIAIVFQIGKFINIGDIPLLGDPLSRYRLSLSGFADYPTRLLPPLFWISIAIYIKEKSKACLVAGGIMLILCTLLMQRQDIAFAVVGAAIMLSLNKRLTKRVFFSVLLLGLSSAYLIGYGAVLRYGKENIGSGLDSFLLPIWIVHAELTVPSKLSLYVIERIGETRLYGLYSLASFYDFFTSGIETGAIYIRDKYVGADTAQSLAAPFSYYVDFGYLGVIFGGTINSSIATYLYAKSRHKQTSSYFYPALYSYIFLSLFLSIRAGTVLVSPLLIYTTIAMLSLTTGGSARFKLARKTAKIILFSSLSISSASLIHGV